jgi:hypothetical protein
MKPVRKTLPFTNKFGDTIQPGDMVYSITTCTHRTCITEGEYVGYIERSGYDYKTRESKNIPYVQVKVPAVRTVYFDKLKNATFKWADYTRDYFNEHVVRSEEKIFRISTLNYNNIIPRSSSTEKLAKAV